MISFGAQLSTIQYTAGDTEDRMKYSSQFQEDTFVWCYIMTSKFHIRTVCCLGRFVASFVCSLSAAGFEEIKPKFLNKYSSFVFYQCSRLSYFSKVDLLPAIVRGTGDFYNTRQLWQHKNTLSRVPCYHSREDSQLWLKSLLKARDNLTLSS